MDVLSKKSAGGLITSGGHLQSEITQSYYAALSELDQRLSKLVVIVSDDEWGCFVKTETDPRYYVINLSRVICRKTCCQVSKTCRFRNVISFFETSERGGKNKRKTQTQMLLLKGPL